MSIVPNQIERLEVSVFVDFAIAHVFAVQPDFAVKQCHVFSIQKRNREVVREGFPFPRLPVIGPKLDGEGRISFLGWCIMEEQKDSVICGIA